MYQTHQSERTQIVFAPQRCARSAAAVLLAQGPRRAAEALTTTPSPSWHDSSGCCCCSRLSLHTPWLLLPPLCPRCCGRSRPGKLSGCLFAIWNACCARQKGCPGSVTACSRQSRRKDGCSQHRGLSAFVSSPLLWKAWLAKRALVSVGSSFLLKPPPSSLPLAPDSHMTAFTTPLPH